LVDPADTGGVRPELRRDALGHAAGGEVEVLQHAGARPVDVRPVLENDVDERGAEEREAAHHLRFWHRQHGRRQGV